MLEPRVGVVRARAHTVGDLVGKAHALPTDCVRDGWALRDLLDNKPQILAVDHSSDHLVGEPAVDRLAKDSWDRGTLEHRGDEPFELGSVENAAHGLLDDPI